MFKTLFKKKTAIDLMAGSNYPVSLDACGACSMRVAGLDESRPDRYVAVMAEYQGGASTGGAHIDPVDDDKTACDICGDDVAPGEFFDIAARPRA